MRRLAGLLYIDSKVMGDIKNKIKNESSKWHILLTTNALNEN